MPLLNYTTKVPAARTVSEVQALLVKAGARKIGTDYDEEGNINAIAFMVETAHGVRGFTLPINADRVAKVLDRDQSAHSRPENAHRVAWRIVKDWLEAQLAIIETEMVTLEQVMLPYMHASDGRTMYELYEAQHLALPSGEAA